jgi:hypothetical protein
MGLILLREDVLHIPAEGYTIATGRCLRGQRGSPPPHILSDRPRTGLQPCWRT